MMNRRLIHIIFLTLLLMSLAGCGKSIDEQAQLGIASAKTTFEESTIEPNTELGNLSIYLPTEYTISEDEADMNYIISDRKHSYILFMNTIEDDSSQLHYQLLKEDTTKQIVQEEKFERNGQFGFSAVVKYDENQYELIVSIGGSKLTVISEAKKIDEKLAQMMEIVHSIQVKK